MKRQPIGQINCMSGRSSRRQLISLAIVTVAIAGAAVMQPPVTGKSQPELNAICETIRRTAGSQPEQALHTIDSALREKLPAEVRRFLNSTKINILLQDQKYAEALAVADDPAQVDGDPDYYLCLRSVVLLHQDKIAEAMEATDKAVRMQPEHSIGYLYRAECFYQLKKGLESERDVRKAERLEKFPSPDFYLSVAQLFGKLGAADDQKRLLLKTTERWPKNPQAYLYLGLAAGFHKQRVEALQYFKQGTEVGRNATIDLLASDFCSILNYQRAAFEYADQATRMDPTSARAFLQRSRALSHLDRKEEALASATRALELDGNSLEAWMRKLQCLTALSRADEAVVCSQKALALYPESIGLRLEVATAHFRARHYTTAIELTTQILKDDPNSATAFHIRGQSHVELGQNWDAIEDFTMSHICIPGEAGPLYNRASTYMALQLPGNALADLNEILRRQPSSPVGHDMRSQSLRRLGFDKLADADARKASGLWSQYEQERE